jgi:hypothetical protein
MSRPFTDTYDMAVLPTTVVVCSETDPNTTYHVQLPYCPCKDFRYRRTLRDLPLEERFCKHLTEALARVGSWHRTPRPTTVYTNLFLNDLMALLTDGKVVGFSLTEARALRRGMTESGGEFSVATGAPVDGKVTYEKLPSRYTLTVYGLPS